MLRSDRRSPRLLAAFCGIAVSTLVALTGCTGAPGDQDSTAPTPSAAASSAAPLTRQQTIARARDVTMRVEVTTCTGYQVGSGFLVGPRLIATAAHVLRGAQTVAVRGLSDGSAGTVIGVDNERDVALIRTTADVGAGDPLAFADDEPSQGDEIVAMGYPDGRPQTPTSGTVSRLGQSVDVDDRRLRDLVQFDAEGNPGSSGGPLLDLRGAVVGMTDSADDYAAGFNYAVSSKTARPLIAAWTDSPAEVIPAHCPDRSTAVSDRSDDADGPGLAYGFRAYFDNLNAAVRNRETHPDDSYGDYDAAYQSMSGRLLKQRSPFERFREDRLDGSYSKVRLVAVRRVDEVTDSVEVTYRHTSPRPGDDKCTYYHDRYQMRLASGVWTLDERKPLSDDGTSC
jgi:S1-C subfamily serine protease